MIQHLKQEFRDLAGKTVWTVLNDKTKTGTLEVRVTVLRGPLPADNLESEIGISDSLYFMYSCFSEKITEIAIYEKNMVKNAGKTMSIFDNFGSLEKETLECYKNSIVEFILANIVD